MRFRTTVICLLALAAAQLSVAQDRYIQSVERWRHEHVKEIAGDSGWLTVAGLFWLKEGINTIGAGNSYDIELTPNFKHGKFGEIDFHNGVATLKVAAGVDARAAGKPVSEIDLISDIDQKQTVIEIGSQSFYVIKREDRYGVRLKDKANRARKEFRGLRWFPVKRAYRVTAAFEAFAEPKEVLIANVLGGNFKMKSPGVLRFKIRGREFTLQPVDEDGRLFIIFRDLSSKTTTYGSGRFLYADKPVNGKVILDFNKAENPSCAFTQFATCPLPPKQNRMDIVINAGEKRYHP